MVEKEEFYYDSENKKTKIHAIKWTPKDKDIIAILQISHGMLEHINRYDEVANSLSEKGILVTGNDHLGHGYSLLNEEDRGYFSDNEGNIAVIEDMNKLKNILKMQYPDVPYFLLGHSMGSFLARQFITIYNDDIQGTIIVGTGYQPYALVKTGEIITRVLALFKGWRYRSTFVNNLAIGGNNKKFEPCRTKVDWLSRDEKVVDDYLCDNKINFIFTLNAFYNMFKGILSLYDKNNLEKVPKNMNLLLLSGGNDPVGGFGKDVKKLYESYIHLGMNDVSLKIYNDARHEIINELDRIIVYEDIFQWIVKRIEINKNIYQVNN